MDKEEQKRNVAIEEVEALWRGVRVRRAQKTKGSLLSLGSTVCPGGDVTHDLK